MMNFKRSIPIAFLAAGAALLAVGCESTAPTDVQLISPQLPPVQAALTPAQMLANIHVCAEGASAVFDVTNVGTSTALPGSPFTVAAGACALVATNNTVASLSITVKVDQQSLPAGIVLDSIRLDSVFPSLSGFATRKITGTDQFQVYLNSDVGFVATYYHSTLQPLTVTKTAAASFDRTYTWDLTKAVAPTTHSGTSGSIAGSSTWTVNATRTVVDNNYSVSGNIVITNPNAVPATFTVADVLDDGTTGTVTCPANTVAAGGSITCTYTAAPSGGSATLNTATVTVTSPAGISGGTATAPVNYVANTIGDAQVTLADPRFSYSQQISGSKTQTFPESFPCPSDASYYTNGVYTRTETNTATLTGANTNLTASASVVITCTLQLASETATGAGYPWSATLNAPNNWFMYTPWNTSGGYTGITSGANLMAGKNYVAGLITGTRGAGANSTSITITLNPGWTFAAGSVAINPMSCTTNQQYVSPGQFAVKKPVSAGATSITVTGLANTACYGIHAVVQH